MWMFCRHVSNVNEIVLIIRRLFEHERPSLYVYTQVGRVMPLCCASSLILHIMKLIMILDFIYLFRYAKQSARWQSFTKYLYNPIHHKKKPTPPKKKQTCIYDWLRNIVIFCQDVIGTCMFQHNLIKIRSFISLFVKHVYGYHPWIDLTQHRSG